MNEKIESSPKTDPATQLPGCSGCAYLSADQKRCRRYPPQNTTTVGLYPLAPTERCGEFSTEWPANGVVDVSKFSTATLERLEQFLEKILNDEEPTNERQTK